MELLEMAATAYVGKELAIRMFGPVIDTIGDDIKELYSVAISNNIRRLFYFVKNKMESHQINNKNSVQLSIIHEIMNNGAFQDNEIFSEYYGGVIAASRENQNDIGKEICQTITRLSSYSLRFHFIIYNAMRNTFLGKNINMRDEIYCSLCRIFIKKSDLDRSMGFSTDNEEYISEIYSSCLTSLVREGLLFSQYSYGKNVQINSNFTMPEPGLVVGPSASGAALLLWAAGYGLKPSGSIFSPHIVLSPENLLLLNEIDIPLAKKVCGGIPPAGGGPRALALIQQMEEYIMRD